MKQKLYDIAHCRAGDKGNTLTLSLIAFVEKDYELLCREATAEKVKEHLKEIVHGDVARYELPNIAALQFVCQQALSGGVTTSLVMDTHSTALEIRLQLPAI